MSDLFRAIPAVDASLNALLDVDPTLEAAPHGRDRVLGRTP